MRTYWADVNQVGRFWRTSDAGIEYRDTATPWFQEWELAELLTVSTLHAGEGCTIRRCTAADAGDNPTM